MTGFKWAYGHLIGASGIADLVMTLEVLKQGKVPGIATLESLDGAMGDFPVSTEVKAPTSSGALVICRGFGGMNVVVAVRVLETTCSYSCS